MRQFQQYNSQMPPFGSISITDVQILDMEGKASFYLSTDFMDVAPLAILYWTSFMYIVKN
jgi:hypothetical protein